MAEQGQSFTSMFTKLAEDLKLPRVDTEQLIEAHRKNIDALARSAEVASEGAKQAEFAKKAFEAAVRNTRDVAELVQRSSTDALKIIQHRMQQSFEEIRGTVEKK